MINRNRYNEGQEASKSLLGRDGALGLKSRHRSSRVTEWEGEMRMRTTKNMDQGVELGGIPAGDEEVDLLETVKGGSSHLPSYGHP